MTHTQEDAAEESGPPARNLRKLPRKRYDSHGGTNQPESKTPARRAPKTTQKRKIQPDSDIESTETVDTDAEDQAPRSQYATPSEVLTRPQTIEDLARILAAPMSNDHVVAPPIMETNTLVVQETIPSPIFTTSQRQLRAVRGKPRGSGRTTRTPKQDHATIGLRRLQKENAGRESILATRHHKAPLTRTQDRAQPGPGPTIPPLVVHTHTANMEPRDEEWTDDGLEEFLEACLRAQPPIPAPVPQKPPARATHAPTTSAINPPAVSRPPSVNPIPTFRVIHQAPQNAPEGPLDTWAMMNEQNAEALERARTHEGQRSASRHRPWPTENHPEQPPLNPPSQRPISQAQVDAWDQGVIEMRRQETQAQE